MVKLYLLYKSIEKPILLLIVAEFFLQMLNAAFTLSLNIYMSKNGYTDPQIAAYTADRFMAVMLFALPFGLFIKNRPLKPIFTACAFALPLISWLLVMAVDTHTVGLLRPMLIVWGIAFTGISIPTLPYILRNAAPEKHTQSIALHAATWSLGLIVVGCSIFLLSNANPELFNEKLLLQLFSLSGIVAALLFLQLPKNEKEYDYGTTPAFLKKGFNLWNQYDWNLIVRAVVPTTLIAVGAGLTIPFMNLFFYKSFGMDTDTFSLLGSATALLVTITTLLVPAIKKQMGYVAIPLTQSMAIASLILLGATDFMSRFEPAFYIAVFAFLVRQPLMSLANPMSSELTMYYVGKNNQELVSAIISAIWSGSWFISSQVFGVLRAMHLRYGTIFFITAGFYIIGVSAYVFLIKDFRRRQIANG